VNPVKSKTTVRLFCCYKLLKDLGTQKCLQRVFLLIGVQLGLSKHIMPKGEFHSEISICVHAVHKIETPNTPRVCIGLEKWYFGINQLYFVPVV
jgi:hypothetical protein